MRSTVWGHESWLCHLLSVGPWAGHLTSLCLCVHGDKAALCLCLVPPPGAQTGSGGVGGRAPRILMGKIRRQNPAGSTACLVGNWSRSRLAGLGAVRGQDGGGAGSAQTHLPEGPGREGEQSSGLGCRTARCPPDPPGLEEVPSGKRGPEGEEGSRRLPGPRPCGNQGRCCCLAACPLPQGSPALTRAPPHPAPTPCLALWPGLAPQSREQGGLCDPWGRGPLQTQPPALLSGEGGAGGHGRAQHSPPVFWILMDPR